MGKEIFQFDDLFKNVQESNLFEDSKTFPDCIPKRALEEINKDYLLEKEKASFNLRKFVSENFAQPRSFSTGYQSDVTRSMRQHIETLWDVLTRKPDNGGGSHISLPYPYVVPGGRFREIYYWDSYFTMLGLQVSGRTDLIRNMIDNFSFLIDSIGYIPNGNRTYFLGRSQPPFYSLMVKLLDEVKEDTLIHYLPQLEREYQFWMRGAESLSVQTPAQSRVVRLPDGAVLNRYWDEGDSPRPEAHKEDVDLSQQSHQDPRELFRHLRAAAESGWDFSTRWFKDKNSFGSIHTTEIIPVDLNCLLMHLEQTLSEASQRTGNTEKAREYVALAKGRKNALVKYCWNEEQEYFVDYDFVARQQKDQLSLAGTFPLFFKVASTEQALGVKRILEEKFLKQGGLTSTLEYSGQQWDAPNGWAPLQWIAYRGLKHYDHHELAGELRRRWLSLNEQVYKKTGKMMEKYNVTDTTLSGGGGEYPNQDGFGWTNGVALAMLKENQ